MKSNDTKYLQSSENNKKRLRESIIQLKVSENIHLSKEDSKVLFNSIKSPTLVNEKLLKAARRYKEIMSKQDN